MNLSSAKSVFPIKVNGSKQMNVSRQALAGATCTLKSIRPTEGILVVTPEMSEIWLREWPYDRQRKVSHQHVTKLTIEIMAGRFRQKTQISFCEIDGVFYLVNGQHTLNAIAKAGIPVTLSVTVTPVESMEQVADEYARHDVGRSRQQADALYAHRMDEELGVTRTVLQYVTSAAIALAYALGEIGFHEQTTLSHDRKLLIVRRHGPLIVRATTDCGVPWSCANANWVRRKNLLACLAFTYSRRPEDAIAFWGGMFADDGLAAGDPRKVLLKDYERSLIQGGIGRTAIGARMIRAGDIPRMASVGWNAFIERRSLTVIKIADATKKTVMFKGCGEILV